MGTGLPVHFVVQSRGHVALELFVAVYTADQLDRNDHVVLQDLPHASEKFGARIFPADSRDQYPGILLPGVFVTQKCLHGTRDAWQTEALVSAKVIQYGSAATPRPKGRPENVVLPQ